MWHLVDASQAPLGRLATRISTILQGKFRISSSTLFLGKHKPIYHPSTDCGDHVIVTNAKNLFLTGKKARDAVYRWHTGYRGGLKEKGMPEMLSKDPTQVIPKIVLFVLDVFLGGVAGNQRDVTKE